jgi:hypothetical protein
MSLFGEKAQQDRSLPEGDEDTTHRTTPTTRDGFVYVVQAAWGGPVKVGWALNPKARLGNLQVASPHLLNVVAQWRGTIDDERAIHAELERAGARRLRGEWFEMDRGLYRQLLSLGAAGRSTGIKTPTGRLCPKCLQRKWVDEDARPVRRKTTGAVGDMLKPWWPAFLG